MCGRLLCMAHTAMGQNGPACPHCASTHEGYESNEDSEMASTRDEYYEPYGGAAAYGQPGFFSDTDSAHMNRPAAQLQPRKRNEYDPKET